MAGVELLKAHINEYPQASFASVATFVIALYTSKAAVITFLARISQQRQHSLVYWTCLGVVGAAGVVSVFIVLVGWPLKSGFYFGFSLNSQSCDLQVRHNSMRQSSQLNFSHRQHDGLYSQR